MRRVGIYGGTFDPPHLAHLRIAEEAREQFDLDCVFFVPNRQPVHRANAVGSPEDRYAMLILATADNPAFRVSRDELERPAPSYSIDTVLQFRERYPEAELFFIVGADEVALLHTWKDADRLLSLCRFLAAPRRPEDVTAASPFPGVAPIHMDPLPMSSTAIRERLARGQSVRYQIPDPVLRYIMSRGLYRT
ncbi:MAG: nicotinate-nucleotide adenylyltransferase [Armatimonadota bacterium]